VLIIHGRLLFSENVKSCPDYKPMAYDYWFPHAIVALFLILFSNFWLDQYLWPKGDSKKGSKAKPNAEFSLSCNREQFQSDFSNTNKSIQKLD
jgi:hypothetical protein